MDSIYKNIWIILAAGFVLFGCADASDSIDAKRQSEARRMESLENEQTGEPENAHLEELDQKTVLEKIPAHLETQIGTAESVQRIDADVILMYPVTENGLVELFDNILFFLLLIIGLVVIGISFLKNLDYNVIKTGRDM